MLGINKDKLEGNKMPREKAKRILYNCTKGITVFNNF